MPSVLKKFPVGFCPMTAKGEGGYDLGEGFVGG